MIANKEFQTDIRLAGNMTASQSEARLENPC